jgi:hypothetical protein
MNSFFLKLIFASPVAFSGGDVVNNGGGLSEQAVVFSAQHYLSFMDSCLLYDNCGARAPTNAFLKPLQKCVLPEISSLRFATPAEVPGLQPHKHYIELSSSEFVINREGIYSAANEPLKIAEAFGYLSRIYMDYCGTLVFAQSAELAKTLSGFVDANSEQVTVGKDSVSLPSKQWLRIRTLYSDLMIEGSQSLFRLSCPSGFLTSCNLTNTNAPQAQSTFKNLSLAQESLHNGILHFEVTGVFISADNARQYFTLTGDFQDGKAIQIQLQNQNLQLPKSEPLK